VAGLLFQSLAFTEAKSMKGPIMSVTESQVQIQKGTEQLTLFITKDTKISLNGKNVAVSDLKMNDVAEVSAEENGDRTFKALSIKATRSDKQPVVTR